MGLNTQVIGTGMPNGQTGSYARQPDMIINTLSLIHIQQKTWNPCGCKIFF